MRKILCNIIMLGALCLISTHSNAQYNDKMNASIQNLEYNGSLLNVKQIMDSLGLKGLSVAVFENYEIAWTKTWGVKGGFSNETIDKNTAFSTASISKAVTATLFAILEEKGLIDLKAPVSTYLKRWQLPESDLTSGINITLEHLLSHTAGTNQGGFEDFYVGDIIPTVVQSLNGEIGDNKAIEFLFTPGTSLQYSGGGYVIAQVAVEDYLGKSLADLAQEYLFSPLKLKSTTMKQPNETGFLSNVAKAHTRDGKILKTGLPITPQIAPSGLWSTPEDMATFLIEIQKALKGLKTKVISKRVAQRVTDIVTTKLMGGWSLGWERRFAFGNHDWFSHGGANSGTGGHVYATMNDGNGIAFFGNGPNSIRIPILNSFRNSIIKSHKWNIPIDKNKYKTITQDIANRVKGNYSHTLFGNLSSTEYKDGKLFVNNFGGEQRLELFYLGGKSFKVDQLNLVIRFDAINPVDNKKYLATLFQNEVKTEIDYTSIKIEGKLPFTYLQEGNYEDALKAYKREKNNNPNNGLVREATLNNIGYQELAAKNNDIALSIFKINTILYPESANAFDSLGEFYMMSGDNKKALINYKKSLELNPKSENAKKMIDKLD